MERVISFQSRDVVDILLRGDLYVPDLNKCRVDSDYAEDGGAKVWVFHFPNLSQKDFYDGSLLQTCRQQMSLPGKWGLTEYYMIEMKVDGDRLSIGRHHNDFKYAKVMDNASISDVVAVYTVHPTQNWYFTQLKPFIIIQQDALFPNSINPLYYYCWDEYREDKGILTELDDLRRQYSRQDFRLLCESLVSLIIKER